MQQPNSSSTVQKFQELCTSKFLEIRNSIRENILEIERNFCNDSRVNFEVKNWKRSEAVNTARHFGYDKNYQDSNFDANKLPNVLDFHLNNSDRKVKQGTKQNNTDQDFGGGEISVIRGRVFKKMGVNFANVYGNMPEGLDPSSRKFWACGVSLVAHPENPFVPAIHMNIRMLATENNYWFGGGIDLNPVITNDEETKFFHNKIQEVCDKYDKSFYRKFSNWCDEYFQLYHRNTYRGIGGIFFDKLGYNESESKIENIYNFVVDLGSNFNNIYSKIVYDNFKKQYTKDDLIKQQQMRSDYAEFNLLYDRGIKFGLQTGGNVEGMFMSLPPQAIWH